jgi:hypothetical protein
MMLFNIDDHPHWTTRFEYTPRLLTNHESSQHGEIPSRHLYTDRDNKNQGNVVNACSSFHSSISLQVGEAAILGCSYLSIQAQYNLFSIGASDEVVARSTGVSDRASVAAVRVKHNAVRTRRA